MKKPDKLYVHSGLHLGLLTTTVNKVDAPDEEKYIRKDALLEWAKNNRDSAGKLSYTEFLDKINSM